MSQAQEPQRNLGIYLDSLASINTTLNQENHDQTTHIQKAHNPRRQGSRGYQPTRGFNQITTVHHLWNASLVGDLHKLLDGLRLNRDRDVLLKLGQVLEVPPKKGLFPLCLVFKNVPHGQEDVADSFVSYCKWTFLAGRKLLFNRDLDLLTPQEASGKPEDLEMYSAWRTHPDSTDFQFYFPQVLVTKTLAVAVARIIQDGKIFVEEAMVPEERATMKKLWEKIDVGVYDNGIPMLFSDVFEGGEPLNRPLVPVLDYFVVSWNGAESTFPEILPRLLDPEDRSFALWDKFSVRPRELRAREQVSAWLAFQRELGQFSYYSDLAVKILGSRYVHFSAKNEIYAIHSGLLPRRELPQQPPPPLQDREEEEEQEETQDRLDPSDKNTIFSVIEEVSRHLKLFPGDWITACQMLNRVLAKFPTDGNSSGDYQVLGKIGYLRTVDELQSSQSDVDLQQSSAISLRKQKNLILKAYSYSAMKKMLSGLKSYRKLTRKRKKKRKNPPHRPPRAGPHEQLLDFNAEEEEESSSEDEDDNNPLDEKGRLKEGWKEFELFDLWEKWEHSYKIYHLVHMPYNTDDPKQKRLLHSSLEKDGIHLNTFVGWVCPISDLVNCYEKCQRDPDLKEQLVGMHHWFQHHYGCGESVKMEFLMKLILRMLYFPYQKTEVSVVFSGPQGIGKSLILKWISFLMGRYALSLHNADCLFGQFQVTDIKTTVFLAVQELHLDLKDKQLNEKRSKLKDLIDGVNLQVNVKYGQLSDIVNTLNLWMVLNGQLVFAMLEDLQATANNQGRRWYINHLTGDFFLKEMLPKSGPMSENENENKQRAAVLAKYFTDSVEADNYFLWRAFVGSWVKRYPPESLKEWIPRLNVPVNHAKDKEIWQAWCLNNRKDEQHRWYNLMKKGQHIDREKALRFASENRNMNLEVEVTDPNSPIGVRTVDLRENDPLVWDGNWLMYWNLDIYYLTHYELITTPKKKDAAPLQDNGATNTVFGRLSPLELKPDKPPIDALTLAQRLSTFLGPGITDKATRASSQHWFRIGTRDECLRRFARALCLPESHCLDSVEDLRTTPPLPQLTPQDMRLALKRMVQDLTPVRPGTPMLLDSQEEEEAGHTMLITSIEKGKEPDSDQDDVILFADD